MFYKEFLKVLSQLVSSPKASVVVDDVPIFIEIISNNIWRISSAHASMDYRVDASKKYLSFRGALRNFLPLANDWKSFLT